MKDFCFGCKDELSNVDVKKMPSLWVCTNQECSRFGLLTVVGFKKVKKNKVG